MARQYLPMSVPRAHAPRVRAVYVVFLWRPDRRRVAFVDLAMVEVLDLILAAGMFSSRLRVPRTKRHASPWLESRSSYPIKGCGAIIRGVVAARRRRKRLSSSLCKRAKRKRAVVGNTRVLGLRQLQVPPWIYQTPHLTTTVSTNAGVARHGRAAWAQLRLACGFKMGQS